MDWDKAIFLAHVSEDKEQVRYFYEKLQDSGLHPWLDEKQLTPGVEWDSKIKEAIRKSRFFVAFLSPKSVKKSSYYQRELRFALSQMEEKPPGTVYVIPVLLAEIEIPDITVGTVKLGRYQAMRLYEPYEQQEFTKLIRTLHNEINQPQSLEIADKPKQRLHITSPYDTQPLEIADKPRQRFHITSSDTQLSLFPITRAELEHEFPTNVINKIQPLLSFDYSSYDHFHPGQEEEIRFFARIQSLSNSLGYPPLLEFLLSKMPSSGPQDLSDLYFDVFRSRWRKFSDRESGAIANYLDTMDIYELIDILEERIEIDELLDILKERIAEDHS